MAASSSLITVHARAARWLLERMNVPARRGNLLAVVGAMSGIAFVAFLLQFWDVIWGEQDTAVAGWAIGLGGLLLLGTALLTDGEITYRDTLAQLRDDRDGNWDRQRVDRTEAVLDRVYPAMTGLFTLVAMLLYVSGIPTLRTAIGLGDAGWPTLVVGAAVMVHLGLTIGAGFWGVLVAITTVVRDIGPPEASQLDYRPFRPQPNQGLHALASLSYRAAMYFTFGAVILPGLIQYLGTIEGASRWVLGVLIAFVVVSGPLLYLVPYAHLRRTETTLWDRVVDGYAELVETTDEATRRLMAEAPTTRRDLEARNLEMQHALRMHREVRELDPREVGRGQFVGLLVPATSAVVLEQGVRLLT